MYKHRHFIVSLIAGLLVLLMLGGIVLSASAERSGTIKARIESLKQEEQEISAQKAEVKAQRESNESDILDLVQQKNQIDRQIMLTQESIETKNELIREYSLLIAEKQNELGDAVLERDSLNAQYRVRIRAMEENGKLTYWSILFKANSFADLLDRVEMINEIARSDERMIERFQEAAQQIEVARQELAAEKLEMEAAKDSLAAEQEELEAQRVEADGLMAELMEDHAEYAALEDKYQKEQAELLAQIATEQTRYQEALDAEERARREAEAAARAREEAARAREQAAAGRENEDSDSDSSSDDEDDDSDSGSGSSYSGSSSDYGFSWPCTARAITCPFGPRYHPITGVYSNHSGMDIGAGYGSPIYACASGTVTTATYGTAYGYYVTINHGNGFSTLYGHMTRYTVSAGDYVTKGEIIGYVGSTGWSTGPHLHLTMYYNGSLVNPLDYLPAGGYFV